MLSRRKDSDTEREGLIRPPAERCCCNCCSMYTGSWCMIIFHVTLQVLGVLIGLIVVIKDSVSSFTNNSSAKYFYVAQVVIFLIWALTLLILIIALQKEKPDYMMPHFIWSFVVAVFCVVQSAMVITSGTATSWVDLFFIVCCIVIIYLLVFEWNLYRYHKYYGPYDNEAHRRPYDEVA